MFRRKKSTQEADQDQERLSLEKGDLSAMLIAAILVYLPALLIMAGVIVGILWLFFMR